MIILFITISYTVQLVVQHCNGFQYIDLPHGHETYYRPKKKLEYRSQIMYEPYPRIKGMKSYLRRHWLQKERPDNKINFKASRREYEDEKDATLKQKIATLLQQTMSETDEKMKDLAEVKEKYKDENDYKAGFVISMIKKSREVLNELFNVAVRHRDEWMALEQLKIFELIVHTNIDITNFLKQLVDIKDGRETFEISSSIKKPANTENPSDPNNSPSEPDNSPSDPNSSPSDPNSSPSDPKTSPSDPNSSPSDPESSPSDPNSSPSDPNSSPSDPNSSPSDPKSISSL